MKVLFVAPWIPSSVRPRSLAILQMLAAEHDVRFLSLVRHEKEARLAHALPVTDRILVTNPRVGSMLRTAWALCSGVSLQQGYASPRRFGAAFQRILTGWQPDVVHLNVFRTVHLVEACGRTPVIVDLDEFRSEYYEQLASLGSHAAWRALGRVEARRMRAREDALVNRGVSLILSGPPPPGRARSNTFVVRSACDFAVHDDRRRAEPIVLFVGRLSYEANVSGLMWFVRECWGDIRRTVPDARLRIVGSDPPRAIMALAGDGIEVHPNVPDVQCHYAAASVAIVPIFRGTGVQMKLIQALSAGVPAVATGTVAARAGLEDGLNVKVADERTAWIEAVCRLVSGDGDAEKLAAGGREWAVANHGSAAVRRQLAAVYASLTR